MKILEWQKQCSKNLKLNLSKWMRAKSIFLYELDFFIIFYDFKKFLRRSFLRVRFNLLK